MTFQILKSYYGSAVLTIEANTEEEAIEIAYETEIDLNDNMGYVKCEVHQ